MSKLPENHLIELHKNIFSHVFIDVILQKSATAYRLYDAELFSANSLESVQNKQPT